MDLQLAGRKAIVCSASAGLGRGAARALALNGVEVLIVARTKDRLKAAAEEISPADYPQTWGTLPVPEVSGLPAE